MTREDVPDDIVDAAPAGGWAEGDAGPAHPGDEQPTLAAKEADDDAAREASASVGTAEGDAPAPDQFVESAEIQQGLDPDIAVHSDTSSDADPE